MLRFEARFHMVMLLNEYSVRVANLFESQFEHQERVRSSDKAEMTEINQFWTDELRDCCPAAAHRVGSVRVDEGIDQWLRDFRESILPDVIRYWPRR